MLLAAEAALHLAFRVCPRFGARLLAPWDPRAAQFHRHSTLVFVGNRYWPEHDEWGFRNDRVPPRADIVTLGDSQTYGTAARPHESWPAQLSEQTGLTVYNMAFGGYCAVQALELLDRALERQPDTILFGFYFGNDLYDAYNAIYRNEAFPEFRDPELVKKFTGLQRRSSIEKDVARITNGAHGDTQSGVEPDSAGPLRRWVSSHVMLYAAARALRDALQCAPNRAVAGFVDEDTAWPARRDVARRTPDTKTIYERETSRTILTPSHRLRVLDTDDPRLAEGLRLCLRALDEIHLRCRKRGVRFAVVLIPTKEFVYSPSLEPGLRTASLDTLARRESQVRERLLTALRDAGIRAIDPLPALRSAAGAGVAIYPASENGHPNALGYAVIASWVQAELGEWPSARD